MRRRLAALILVSSIIISTTSMVGAEWRRVIGGTTSTPTTFLAAEIEDWRASYYLESYSVQLMSEGKGQLSIDMIVDGTGRMSRIGVLDIIIEEKNTSTGTWHEYSFISGIDDPDTYYWYNSWDYLKTIYFNGVVGRYYRVTITAHAVLDNVGSDTGRVTSSTVQCK